MARSITRLRGFTIPAGDSGYPVFTEFGADLPEILRWPGSTSHHFGPVRER